MVKNSKLYFQIFLFLIICTNIKTIPITAEYSKENNTISFNDETFYSKTDLTSKQLQILEDKSDTDTSEGAFWLNILMIIIATLTAGVMSGLTVGYLSIDDLVLELKANTGNDIEKYYSNRILPIISQRHWLLVTLLVCNATAMEALPVFLGRLVHEYMAIIISVTLVLFFGEIIPQALCTGPSQLQIASFLAPTTKFFMWVTFPISYPIALLLDYLVGKHSKSRFVNTDLKGLIELHTLEALDKLNGGNSLHKVDSSGLGLHSEQADLMISALEIKENKAIEMMIPINKTFMFDYDKSVNKETLDVILSKGFSRIPIYDRDIHNIIGILRIKQLIGIDICQNKSLRELGLKLSLPIIVHPTCPALDLLREFRKGKSHMAFITEHVEDFQKKYGLNDTNSFMEDPIFSLRKGNVKTSSSVLGVVTLEDVIEKMINIQILDEDDYANLSKERNQKNKIYSKLINLKFLGTAITKELARSFLHDKFQLNEVGIKHKDIASSFDLRHFEDFEYHDKKKLTEPLL